MNHICNSYSLIKNFFNFKGKQNKYDEREYQIGIRERNIELQRANLFKDEKHLRI